MTSVDNLDLSESESISRDTEKLLDEIAPLPKKQSTLYPIICAAIIAAIVYVINSSYFTHWFGEVQYLGIVQVAIIFSFTLLIILYFF